MRREETVRTVRIIRHMILSATGTGAEKKQQSADNGGYHAYNGVRARICVPDSVSLYIKERTRETFSGPLQGSVGAHTVTVRINKGICRNTRYTGKKHVIHRAGEKEKTL